ncbi:MAG: hypothetical protein B7X99_11855, partial [Rhizobiales bacterium 17-65-6]
MVRSIRPSRRRHGAAAQGRPMFSRLIGRSAGRFGPPQGEFMAFAHSGVSRRAVIAGLAAALVMGKRVGYGKEPMAPHNLVLTLVGASMLWV